MPVHQQAFILGKILADIVVNCNNDIPLAESGKIAWRSFNHRAYRDVPAYRIQFHTRVYVGERIAVKAIGPEVDLPRRVINDQIKALKDLFPINPPRYGYEVTLYWSSNTMAGTFRNR